MLSRRQQWRIAETESTVANEQPEIILTRQAAEVVLHGLDVAANEDELNMNMPGLRPLMEAIAAQHPDLFPVWWWEHPPYQAL